MSIIIHVKKKPDSNVMSIGVINVKEKFDKSYVPAVCVIYVKEKPVTVHVMSNGLIYVKKKLDKSWHVNRCSSRQRETRSQNINRCHFCLAKSNASHVIHVKEKLDISFIMSVGVIHVKKNPNISFVMPIGVIHVKEKPNKNLSYQWV